MRDRDRAGDWGWDWERGMGRSKERVFLQRDLLSSEIRSMSMSETLLKRLTRGPFFRRFAGPWLIGRTGHCSLGARGQSVPLGVCLRRDRSCVTGLRLRWFGRLKAELGGLCICVGGHCSRCVYYHRSTGLLKGSPVLSIVP